MMKKWGVGVFVYRLQPQAQLGQMNPSSWCQNNTQCDEESLLLLSSVHNFYILLDHQSLESPSFVEIIFMAQQSYVKALN